MLRNLKAEMARRDVKPKEIADLLGVRPATIYDKLNGHYGFSFNEAKMIKRVFFHNCDIEYLFEDEGGEPDIKEKSEVT